MWPSEEHNKDTTSQELTALIYLSLRMSEHIFSHIRGKKHASIKPETLSDRELEVFELIGLCRNNNQISEQLNISPKTVDAHRANIKSKLGLPDAPSLLREAVLWVEQSGQGRSEDS